MELPGDQALAVKALGSGNGLETVEVGGNTGYWITGRHTLTVSTPGRGQRGLRVTDNVLVWTVGDVSIRLESSLTKARALELARTVG